MSLTRHERFEVSASSYFEALFLLLLLALTYSEMATPGAVVFVPALAPGVQHLVIRLGNGRFSFSLEAV